MIDEVELAAAAAEASTGARSLLAVVPLCMDPSAKQRNRVWTAQEESYVRENYGRISDEEIAANLGRTLASLDNHIKREMHLCAPSKDPRIMTAEQVSWGLGMGCGKSVHKLMDDGLMPHRRLPMADLNRVIDRQALLLWMLEPEHWVYFRPERVNAPTTQGKRRLGDCYDFPFWESARELVLAARAAWKDEWLTPGQASVVLGFKNKRTGAHNINTAIHKGTIKATRWGNWWIKRSALPGPGMTVNVYGAVVPKVKPKYACPRGMAHANRGTCRKLRYCREILDRRAREATA